MILGVIGSSSNQCKRLLKCISDRKKKLIHLYLFKHREGIKIEEIHKEFSEVLFASDLEEMLCCDGIIISSPNNTHYSYLSFLISRQYKGYIFCEKPPVETYEEIEKLSNITDVYKKHILFGFNLRYSKMTDCFKGTMEYPLGKLLYCNIISGHGLAYKTDYKDSWRNDNNRNALGVYETVMIHYIDLFLYTMGKPSYDYVWVNTLASEGRVPDNCTYEAHNGAATAHFFVSYTVPYNNVAEFIFENGIVMVNDTEIELYAPRETYDQYGRFTSPPLISSVHFQRDLWEDSYINIMDFFLKCIDTAIEIPIEQYDKSVETNRYILEKKIYRN